uniref:Retrotransposon gag domain-containing protein n=1 Tax=Tanacetum cinerariifolium TaxID=118510 RepID=A0A699I8H5_TANCI|nr:hypothetical protein [Tanacetum cinerariifolium]
MSSTKELFTSFENPEQEFRSSRKLFKTPSFNKSSSPEFDLFSDLEEHSEEEVVGTMTETMEEYMCTTRGDYGSGVTRPKIDAKYHFKLKGQFLKELRDNTFSGSDLEDANEHIKKVIEIVNLFHIPNITQEQIMLRDFPMFLTGATSRWLRNKPSGLITTWEDLKTIFLSKEIKKVNEKVYASQVGCELCKGPHYTKDWPLKEDGKTLKEAYWTQFDVPFPQGGQYRATAPGVYQRNNENPSYQERRQSMKETLSSKYYTNILNKRNFKFILYLLGMVRYRNTEPFELAQIATKGNLERLLPHARGLEFKPRRGGFPSGAKKEWGLSPKAKVRVLHTAQLDVTVCSNH